MRIATWNLEAKNHISPKRAEVFRQEMDKIAADIWVITEPLLSFSPATPGAGYRMVASSYEATDVQDETDAKCVADRRWVAIWSKLPARKLEVLREPDRMASIRVERPGQRDLVVVGTVLPWRADQRLAPCTGGDAFCHSLHLQAAEWVRLWGNPRACAFCVAGDFNQELNGTLNTGTSDGIAALERELTRLDLVCLTRDLQVGKHSHPAIDHICIGGGLRSLSSPSARTWKFCRPVCHFFPSALDGLAEPSPEPVWCVDSVRDNKRCPVTDHYGAYADVEISPI